jgi:hypothetical protein
VLLVQTGQSVNSLPNVQVPVQNCTILQCFIVHATRSVKVHQANFPTHPTTHLLEFPRWSYCQNTEDCAEDQQSHGNSSGAWRPFHRGCLLVFVSCFHLFRRSAPCINTSLLHSKRKTLISEIQNPFV